MSSFASPPSPLALISITYSPGARPASGSSNCGSPAFGDAAAAAGTRPRKYGEPSGATAVIDTRAGSSDPATRSPGAFGTGSQTSVTRVLPFSPREVPIHVRTTFARPGRLIDASAASTGLGGAGLGGASARAVSSRFSAQ